MNSAVSIAARATIDAAPADVFCLLGDLDRHGQLTDRGMRIISLHGPPGRRSGGLVELRGPAGLRRVARTRVRGADPHSRLWGTAETAGGSEASLEWLVRPHGGCSDVEVRLHVRTRSWRDRMLLQLGGRAWLRARLRGALDRVRSCVAV